MSFVLSLVFTRISQNAVSYTKRLLVINQKGSMMMTPQQFLESNSHEEISRCIVHQLQKDESSIGAVIKTCHGFFWLDFRHEIHSNTFFRTVKETIAEFNLWLESEDNTSAFSFH